MHYIVRNIFYLKFGHYKDVKKLLDEGFEKNLMPKKDLNTRVLTDFTGYAYRLIMEQGYESLAEIENEMASGMNEGEWQKWYEQFKAHVDSSNREILKQVL